MSDLSPALKFVKGAVAKKDFTPELTHFRIRGGHVSGYNGKLSLSHPIDLDLDIAPLAVPFEKALSSAPEGVPITLDVTAAGRLAVRAGKFKVFVSCHADIADSLFLEPEGTLHEIDIGLLGILNDVYPFIAEDASRPWAQAVLLTGHSAYATNNLILVERWCDVNFPTPLILPLDAIKEIIRINIEPCAMQLSERSVTFHYPNGAWLRTQFLNVEWPPVAKVIAKPLDALIPAPPEFGADVKRISGFVEEGGKIYITGNVMSTTREENAGAAVELPYAIGDGVYHVVPLLKVASVAEKIDFTQFPAVFTLARMRGVIIGMKS